VRQILWKSVNICRNYGEIKKVSVIFGIAYYLLLRVNSSFFEFDALPSGIIAASMIMLKMQKD